MGYRRQSPGSPREFVLPVGTHSEFRELHGTAAQLYAGRDVIPELKAVDKQEGEEPKDVPGSGETEKPVPGD